MHYGKTLSVSIFSVFACDVKGKEKRGVQHTFHIKCWICATDKQAHLERRTRTVLKYIRDLRSEAPESAKLAPVCTAVPNILLRQIKPQLREQRSGRTAAHSWPALDASPGQSAVLTAPAVHISINLRVSNHAKYMFEFAQNWSEWWQTPVVYFSWATPKPMECRVWCPLGAHLKAKQNKSKKKETGGNLGNTTAGRSLSGENRVFPGSARTLKISTFPTKSNVYHRCTSINTIFTGDLNKASIIGEDV